MNLLDLSIVQQVSRNIKSRENIELAQEAERRRRLYKEAVVRKIFQWLEQDDFENDGSISVYFNDRKTSYLVAICYVDKNNSMGMDNYFDFAIEEMKSFENNEYLFKNFPSFKKEIPTDVLIKKSIENRGLKKFHIEGKNDGEFKFTYMRFNIPKYLAKQIKLFGKIYETADLNQYAKC